MMGFCSLLILLSGSASSPAFAEDALVFEETIHAVWVQVKERKALEPFDSGYHTTARVRTVRRYQWRAHRILAEFDFREDSHPESVSKESQKALKNRLRKCLKSSDMEEALAPLKIGLEMGMAPRQDQVDSLEQELTRCLEPAIPVQLEFKSLDHRIDTRETGWVDRPQELR